MLKQDSQATKAGRLRLKNLSRQRNYQKNLADYLRIIDFNSKIELKALNTEIRGVKSIFNAARQKAGLPKLPNKNNK